MSAKHAVLGLLRDGPAYPYQLGERLQERLGPAWAINSGQLYQIIKKLEKAGLIERIGGTAEEDRDRRHIFAITGDGAGEFERWFEEDKSGARMLRRPLLVKIALAGPERLRDALEQIEAYERDCTTRLGELSRKRDAVPMGAPRIRADHVVLMLGLNADIAHLEAELGWARHAHERTTWLLEQDAIWPRRRQRPAAIAEDAGSRESAREELFGRIARRQRSS